MENDGGYYAIKGFAYQIDKAILEILNSEDTSTPIGIERIQDIDANSFVIQVKYKETARFSPSQIKEPVLQLFEEFSSNRTNKYILYAYFQDQNGYEPTISLDQLNLFLGLRASSFNDQFKLDFLKSFKLQFAPEFQRQFLDILNRLQTAGLINNYDEGIFYYSRIVYHIQSIVISSPSSIQRFCSKEDIFRLIREGRKIVFDSALRQYQGEEAYFRLIKSKFIKPKTNQQNYIFFGNIQDPENLGKIIFDILDKYHHRATWDLKPPIFIIEDIYIEKVKRYLIACHKKINDGYEHIEFNHALFFEEAIINRNKVGTRAGDKLEKISFCTRILSKSKFEGINLTDLKIKPHMVYYFDCHYFKPFEDLPSFKIERLCSDQIVSLFS
jgi:hypothetical protein